MLIVTVKVVLCVQKCFLGKNVLKVLCVLQAHREGAHREADQDAPQRDHDAERPGERHL